MLPAKEMKTCLLCEKPLKGRSDKKFCDDYCRASYNNDLKSPVNNYIRNVNNALSKNRRILGAVLGSETISKTSREKLLQNGFSFKHITHLFSNKKGNTYFFCYDMGYLPLENDRFLVVKRNEEQF